MIKVRVLLLLVVLAFTHGCIDDHKILAEVHDYFPGAVIYKFDSRVLWVQTQVDGITGKFAEETFDTFLNKIEARTQEKSRGFITFSQAMAHDGYVYLVLGFRGGIIVWDRRVNLRWTLNMAQARTWFIENLGYFPQQHQIQIVRK